MAMRLKINTSFGELFHEKKKETKFLINVLYQP